MTKNESIPLEHWERQVWGWGVLLAISLGLLLGTLSNWDASPGVVGLVVALVVMVVATIVVFVIRKAFVHQQRLQDEAESLRNQFQKWNAWLPKSAADRESQIASGLALTPDSLSQMAMISDRVRAAMIRMQYEWVEATTVLANLDGGVIVLDPSGRITLINAAAKTFFLIDRPCLGQPLVQSIRQPEIIDAVQKIRGDQSPREVHVEVRSDAGVRRLLRVRCSSLLYGEASAVLIAAYDESEAKRSEEVRREFVANVSHELKTPLAAIKGYAETIELAIEDDPDAAKHFLSQIQEQCKRLELLIADMMTLARAQAGIQHLRPTTVDLETIIAESIATYTPVAAARRIELTHIKIQPPVTVFADREATLTIANNVIGNAIRYTPEGGAVRASCRKEGTFGVLVVEDNGIGIAENEQKRIFERFYRVDKSRKYASGGTGLGLSIVKNLTQAQDGEVRLRSQQGKGSTFEIFLPNSPPQRTPSLRVE